MMRYGFMQGAMWTAFHGSFKEAVKTVLDEKDADGVMKRAKKKYLNEKLNSSSGQSGKFAGLNSTLHLNKFIYLPYNEPISTQS